MHNNEAVINNETLYFIGDVHGRLDKLESMLEHLDYYPERTPEYIYGRLVFVGDLIDNKNIDNVDHLAVLQRIKSLCDSGYADCVMGNHEFNAIGWYMHHPVTGEPLRSHKPSNRKQHGVFLEQVGENSPAHIGWIEWFKTLPLFKDYGHVRAVHACWHPEWMDQLRPYLNEDNTLKAEHWVDAFTEGHELYTLCEAVLKGPEVVLPPGYSFKDKHGKERYNIRVRWWLDNATTYRAVGQVQDSEVMGLPDMPLPQALRNPEQDVAVVVGHYTLSGMPQPLSESVICVDYNAAFEGPLVCYALSKNDDDRPHYPDEDNYLSPDLPDYGRDGSMALYMLCEQMSQRFPLPEMSDEAEEELSALISEILWRNWDPIGMYGIDECRGEYDGYVPAVARIALSNRRADLSAFLIGMMVSAMSSKADDMRCDRVAWRISQEVAKWRQKHGVPVTQPVDTPWPDGEVISCACEVAEMPEICTEEAE